MKHIKAISKKLFDSHFSNEKFIKCTDACFISILDIDNDEQKFDLSIENFLQVKMWDIENDITDSNGFFYEKPSDIELKKIVNFVNKHIDKSVFIIHCSAGISRSGAVAAYIKDKFIQDIDIIEFNRENRFILPNIYIKKKLKVLDKKLR